MNSRGNLDTGGIIRHGQRQIVQPAPFGVSTGIQRVSWSMKQKKKRGNSLACPMTIKNYQP